MSIANAENILPNLPAEVSSTKDKKDFTIVHEEDYSSADDSDFDVAEAEEEFEDVSEDIAESEEDEEVDDETVSEKPEAEELVGQISLSEEATMAYEAALSKGLSSTDDALNFVGRNNHQQKVIDNYIALVDSSVTSDYDTMSDEIFTIRRGLNRGLSDLAAAAGVKVNGGAIDYLSSVLKGFVRTTLEEASKFASFSEEGLVSEHSVLSALRHLGRPVYNGFSETTKMEMVSDEEVDSDDLSEDEEEVVLAEDPVEAAFVPIEIYDSLAAPIMADLDLSLSEDTLSIVRDSAEDYLVQLLQGAGKSSAFAKSSQVGAAELKFTLDMWKNMPGGQNMARSLRL